MDTYPQCDGPTRTIKREIALQCLTKDVLAIVAIWIAEPPLALYAALEVCTVDALEHRPDYVLLAPIRY